MSAQTLGLLRLLSRSKTERFILLSDKQFFVDNAMFGPADPKFFHDGVTALVDANLVTVDHTNRGELMLRLNIRGAKLAELLPPPTEDGPNFVLP